MKKCFIILLLLATRPLSAQQKVVTDRSQLFVAYLNQTRISDKWGIWTDLHYRRSDNFADRNFLALGRLGLTYYLREDVRITAAYAYVHAFPDPGLKTAKPEHRPWQQIWWRNKYSHFQLTQALRLEQRFVRKVSNDVLTDDYTYSNRIRFNIMATVPLKKKSAEKSRLFAVVNNEVFLSFGTNVVYNHFDQNRFFTGLGWQFNSNWSAHLGYMNLFQQLSSGNTFFNNHCIRLFVYHNPDLRRKDENKP